MSQRGGWLAAQPSVNDSFLVVQHLKPTATYDISLAINQINLQKHRKKETITIPKKKCLAQKLQKRLIGKSEPSTTKKLSLSTKHTQPPSPKPQSASRNSTHHLISCSLV